ncbi:MAG: hypothetical protein ACQEXQ_29955 [Bacillota bacterium]
MSRKIKLIILLMVLVILGLTLLSIHYHRQYRLYKSADYNAYTLAINGITSNGIGTPLMETSRALELINQNSPDMKKGVESWLMEVASNLSVAEKSAMIASKHLNISIKENSRADSIDELSGFFRYINTSLLDIIRTEKDFEQWKQACMELNEIMMFLDENLDEAVLSRGDYYEVKQHWNQLMEKVYIQHPKSRLLKSYYFMYGLVE